MSMPTPPAFADLAIVDQSIVDVPVQGLSGTGGVWIAVPRVYRSTIDGAQGQDISAFLDIGSYIDWDADRQITMAGSLTFRNRCLDDFGYVLVYLDLWREDGTIHNLSLGHYAATLPDAIWGIASGSFTYALEDLTGVLADSTTHKATSFTSGSNIGTNLGAVCTAAGISRHRFPNTTKTLAKHVSIPRGTSRLAIANEQAGYGSFLPVYPRMDGMLTTSHLKALANTAPAATWAGDDLLMEPQETPDLEGFGNVVVASRQPEGGDPLVYVYKNKDIRSAASVLAGTGIGREIRLPDISLPDAPDDDALDDAAAAALETGRSYGKPLVTQVLASPALAPHRAIDLTYIAADGDLSGRYRLKYFRIPVEAGQAVADVTLGRVDAFEPAEIDDE